MITASMNKAKILTARIPAEYAGRRLDQALAALFPDITRTQLQQWIEAGHVVLDRRQPRKRDKVAGGETVAIDVPAPAPNESAPEAIPLDIVYEDEELLVINKPPGLVVHPGAGNREHTLLNALLHHHPPAAHLPRAGIVHRLDKDTSGLLVVAKTERTRMRLVRALQKRAVEREYIAIVNGVLVAGGNVDAPIGRHAHDRLRMAVTESGKSALTQYRVLKRYRAHTLLQLKLESGRMHQIRVHMAHLHYPIVGDPVYGGRLRLPKGASERLVQALRGFKRQALHAAKLAFDHPANGERMQWAASTPSDMGDLMEALAEDARAHNSS